MKPGGFRLCHGSDQRRDIVDPQPGFFTVCQKLQLLLGTISGARAHQLVKANPRIQNARPAEGNLPGADLHGFGKPQAHDPVGKRRRAVSNFEDDHIRFRKLVIGRQNLPFVVRDKLLIVVAQQTHISLRPADGHIPALRQAALGDGIDARRSVGSWIFFEAVPVALVDDDHIAGQTGFPHQRVVSLVHTGHQYV